MATVGDVTIVSLAGKFRFQILLMLRVLKSTTGAEFSAVVESSQHSTAFEKKHDTATSTTNYSILLLNSNS